MGGASSSALNFHNLDGSGYDFLTDNIITLDSINPMVCSARGRGMTLGHDCISY